MMLDAAQQAFQGGLVSPPPSGAGPGASAAPGGLDAVHAGSVADALLASGLLSPRRARATHKVLQAPSMSQDLWHDLSGWGESELHPAQRAGDVFSQVPGQRFLKARRDEPVETRSAELRPDDRETGHADQVRYARRSICRRDPDAEGRLAQLALLALGWTKELDYSDRGRWVGAHSRCAIRWLPLLGKPTVSADECTAYVWLPDRTRRPEPTPSPADRLCWEASPLEKAVPDRRTGSPSSYPTRKRPTWPPFNQSIFLRVQHGRARPKELGYEFAKASRGKLPPWMSSAQQCGQGCDGELHPWRASQGRPERRPRWSRPELTTQAAGNVLKDFTSGATNKKLVAINTGDRASGRAQSPH